MLVAAGLAAGSLTTATAATLITGRQIKDSTITGRDIRNGTIRSSDLARSAQPMRGPQGPVGPQGALGSVGPQGPPGPPPGLPPLTESPTLLANIPAGQERGLFVDCPNGQRAISGSYDLRFGDARVNVSQSRGTRWFFDITNDDSVQTTQARLYVLCTP